MSTSVRSLAVQADGRILVSGNFSALGGQLCSFLGRLNPDGTLDDRFNPGPDSAVDAVALQADGKILAGGWFSELGGQQRTYIARLSNTESAMHSLSYDGSSITWLRGGGSPEVWRTTFEVATNAGNWLPLGAGTRIAGGWSMARPSLPEGCTIRARGYAAGANCSLVEELLLTAANNPLRIVMSDGSAGFNSGKFGFNVAGAVGSTVVVEGSSNLLNWGPIVTNTLSSPIFYFSDPSSGTWPKQFYRVRMQ